ncbi:hypothetical protein [Bartonella sp. CB169]|uniref:hypothetical protein n=1 Tax=Bartonella sp. CB169 TaxID=3112257 RepID=UPI00300E552F
MWTLLLVLAKTGEVLSRQDSDANDKFKKQKQSLMKKLQETFQLSDNPILCPEKKIAIKSALTFAQIIMFCVSSLVDNDSHRLV